MTRFAPATERWFSETFPGPTEIQSAGWAAVASGEHALLVAPTGSGKTLAAFLWAIDYTTRLPEEAPPGVRILYVSPLKALAYDIERNLRAPLIGIQRAAEGMDSGIRHVRIDVRTGDTPAGDRRRQLRRPADILVTTPESLFLLLGSRARATLTTVHTVIVDEIHSLAPTKRGAHLALSLERLSEIAEHDPQRVGLSATVRPGEEVARFLAGARSTRVVDASRRADLDLAVVVPGPERAAAAPPCPPRRSGPLLAHPAPPPERGLWQAIYPALLAEVAAHRSTIIFVNSRGLCERLTQRLNELAGTELVRAHHGSVAREQRIQIEDGLKRGVIRAIVATSSLELGIDMGAVDLVVLIESPGSVARGLQRVGRSGHQVEGRSRGRIYPKFPGDLLEAAVVAQHMREGRIEAIRCLENPLDVLAQQLVAMCCDAPRTPQAVLALAARAHPFRQLTLPLVVAVLDMLCGRYPSDEFADLTPRLAWDRARDLLTARRGTAMLSRMNAGTIPDRGQYGVFLGAAGPRVGELDEEMVFETRAGENIILGASTWRIERITRDRVEVSPAPGEPGRMPFWHGDGVGRPFELGQALGTFLAELRSALGDAGGAPAGRGRAAAWLAERTPLNGAAASQLADYVARQLEHAGVVPTDRTIVVERFRDELGDWRVCILSPFGAPVHAPWAMALQRQLGERAGFEVEVMYTDDGIVLRFADAQALPDEADLFPDPEDIQDLVTDQLADTALFSALFRENAARALLLPRRHVNRRNPLWAQRRKAQTLLATVRRYPGFAVVLETYRHALNDVFDLPGLRTVLGGVRSRSIRVQGVETASASPFARSLVFAYVAAYIYEQDAPLAERKAQALTLDRELLRELLGEAELRELIDAGALAELERDLAGLNPERRARDRHEIHDLLRRLGDLGAEELRARAAADPRPWLAALERERRAVAIRLAGEPRWVAAEEAGLYRDALGAQPPPGLPDAFLEPVDHPLERIARRYARTHGPFTTAQAGARYGLRPAQLEPVLSLLEARGALVRGEIRPAGTGLEWCDAQVLKQLKRRTLATLRNQIAPVADHALASFLLQWHRVGTEQPPGGDLEAALVQLEGLALPWSALQGAILPARVRGFGAGMLDAISASGQLVWVGRGALGARDGRVAVYRRERAALLLDAEAYSAPSPAHSAVLAHLEARGASFAPEIEEAVRAAGTPLTRREFEAVLWDLVWAGQLTNDTFAPLRALGAAARPRGRGRSVEVAGGRWSLVRQLARPGLSPTEATLARTTMLLARYAVVSRESASAEEIPGGFGPIYRTLREMEESGRVRRGYFIEGLAAAQFAEPGAVDRLRARAEPAGPDSEDSGVVLLAAVDPANPFGALLPWPEPGSEQALRPRRIAGAWVVLWGGAPVLYSGANRRNPTTFPSTLQRAPDPQSVLAEALQRVGSLSGYPRVRRPHPVVERIDGAPVGQSPHLAALQAAGYRRDYRGWAYCEPPAPGAARTAAGA